MFNKKEIEELQNKIDKIERKITNISNDIDGIDKVIGYPLMATDGYRVPMSDVVSQILDHLNLEYCHQKAQWLLRKKE